MSGTLRTLLGARAAAVVGRQAERAVLLDLAEGDRPLVVAVHGIAGIGKSALLAAFAEDARAHGAAVVSLDCGGIEPTERGFLAALDRAIGALRAEPPGRRRPMATVTEAAAALSGLGHRVVLVLDTYEQLRSLDTWLRQELVPGLRDNTRLALAGREPPVAAWISDFGDLLAIVPLANLAAADADALLYLIENPAVREPFFPTASHRYAVEPARPADEAQITAIAHAHQPAGAVTMMRSWWDTMPSAFRVARDADGSPAAFQCLCEAASVPARLLAADPVAATWREHLRANPVPRGQQVLFLRHMLAADGGEATTPAHAALILDLKRRYLEMRPRLRRIYSLAADPAAALSQFAPLGFARLPDGAAEIGGTTYHALYNDFGPSSIDGWLTDLAAREMLIDNHALLDPGRRQLILDGTRADLTKLEFDVLQYLHEREGRIVSRAALLRDVWGYEWSGGSNVVEVVISALRRKLGDRAGSLQTVRGAGYRFTAPP